MRRAFTLVELLIVVLLISIVYAMYFYTVKINDDDAIPFRLFNVKSFMNKKAIKYGNKLTLVCSHEKKTCYLLDAKAQLVEEFELDEKVDTYLLKANENLERTRFKNMEISENLYLEPNLIFKRFESGLFETLIYYTRDQKWIYVGPYFDDAKEFINKEEIISYIKKKEYLPMFGGLAE